VSPLFQRRLVPAFALAFLLVSAFPLTADTAKAADASKAAASALPTDEDVVKPPENPLLRFEIVSLGSFPITVFYTDFLFDLALYFSNGFDSNYAPWPFNGSSSSSLTDNESLVRLGAALGLSLTVGAVDWLIHSSKLKAQKRLREARQDLGQ
jgi:hypothetical protein